MKRLALVVSLFLALTLQAPAAQAHTIDRCRFGPEFTVAAVKHTINCALWYYPVSAGAATVRCIADRESHFHARAVNAASLSSGVFQIIPSTWAAWHGRMPDFNRWWGVGGDVLNGRNNVLTAIRVMHNTRSLAPWAGPGC